MNATTANIVKAWRLSSEADRRAGADWYREARRIAFELADGNLEMGAGVIAALSPRLQWTTNVRAAYDTFGHGNARGGFGANKRKANAILSGAHPLDILGGKKVRAFYECIVTGGETDNVCIDMHAYNIAVNAVTDDGGARELARPGGYERIQRLYVRAAERLSRELGRHVTPAEVQATTWVYWRRAGKGAQHASDVRRRKS